MPRVKQVKARKDYPDHGVKKGDMCYVWSVKTGPRSSRNYRQLTPPKPHQLTSSAFLGTAYELNERIEALTADDLEDELQEIIDEIQELGDEQDEKWNNMPESLQYSSTGELLEGRRDSCEEWFSNLESVKDNLPERPTWTVVELPDEPEEPDSADFAAPEHYDAAMIKWEEEQCKWEEEKDEAEAYESELQSQLEEAQGYLYEGE